MKKISALCISGFIALGFSMSLNAQSSGKDLDQGELLKQFIGTWNAEIAKDTSITWEAIPVGKGYESIITWKANGEPYRTAKGICGFAMGGKKVNMFNLFPNGSIERAFGEFVSENKIVMEGYNYDHSKILAKYEINFPTPDTWNAKVKMKGSTGTWDVVINYSYVRIK